MDRDGELAVIQRPRSMITDCALAGLPASSNADSMRLRSTIPWLISAALLTAQALSAAPAPVYTEWPFDASEAERRQKETAEALNIPVKKTITVGKDPSGKPVTMDFMLIPAGTFVMGTPEPVPPVEPPDDAWIGWTIFSVGLALGVSLLVLMVSRAIRLRRWPQFPLRGLLMAMVAVSVIVLGVSRGRETEKHWDAFRDTKAQYPRQMKDFENAKGWDETPAHLVTITRPFYLGTTEVTQEQWQAVMGSTPSHFKGPTLPVETMSWDDCRKFVEKMTAGTVPTWRLPTEAEWEYACRAGTATPFNTGETISTDQANYNGNRIYGSGRKGVYRQKTTVVGSFTANAWGLHDMHGNVWESCQDGYGKDYYEKSPSSDPPGPADSGYRVLRGCGWYYGPVYCRSALRRRGSPDVRDSGIGFRVVLSAAPGP
jgi:formylglycine-generating enzyme required for sulfatase activity